MYELVQNPHSPPCGHTIIIDRPHFINFRHFGNVNRGDSAYYTFFHHAPHSTPTLTCWRSSPFHLRFFGPLGLVGCAVVEPSASMGPGVSTANRTFASIDLPHFPFPPPLIRCPRVDLV